MQRFESAAAKYKEAQKYLEKYRKEVSGKSYYHTTQDREHAEKLQTILDAKGEDKTVPPHWEAPIQIHFELTACSIQVTLAHCSLAH